MRLSAVVYLLGRILGFYTLTMFVPLIVSMVLGEGGVTIFVLHILVSASLTMLFLLYPIEPSVIRRNEGYAVVVISWCVLGALSAIPFYFSGMSHSWLFAWFEGVSGITTTGAEVFDLSHWNTSLLFYHQWLQGVGGIGIIILMLAVLPHFGVAGNHLYQAEVKDDKIAPRLNQTTRVIIIWYALVVILCGFAYKMVGLNPFESICAALSTTSTGGFYIYNEGFSAHPELGVSMVGAFFMLIGAIGFKTHLGVWLYHRWSLYWQDYETRIYLVAVLMLMLALSFFSWTMPHLNITHLLFGTLSMLTTTGLSQHGMFSWPSGIIALWFILCLIGGCSGSTTGGLRIYRVVFFQQEIKKTLSTLLHPNKVSEYYLGEKPFVSSMRRTIRGFLALFILTFIMAWLTAVFMGYRSNDALPLIWACLTNTGIVLSGIGHEVGYGVLSHGMQCLLTVLMIMGRVEIMMFYLCLLPSFWRD